MARLSGLQREVLSLYRQCLREIRKKPTVSDLAYLYFLSFFWFPQTEHTQESRANFKAYARYVAPPLISSVQSD